MKREYHEKESILLFGKPYTEVHAWLDGLSWKDGKFNPYHRKYRHTAEGIEYIRQKYGEIAAKVAERHILSDLTIFKGIFKEKNYGIPLNTKDYENKYGYIRIIANFGK